jgi:type IV pilus assembly protein PilY1
MHQATTSVRAMSRPAPRGGRWSGRAAVRSAALAALLLCGSTASAQAIDGTLACTKDVGAGGWLSANATRLTAESRLYQASFEARDWSGRLRAVKVDSTGALGAALWEATIPAAGQRRILTSSGASAGIDFTWQALGAAGMQALIGDADTLEYLRGDPSREISAAGATGFRKRSTRLGAVVNSRIALSGAEDFGYEGLVDTADLASPASVAGLAYSAYLRAKASRTALVLVGANDGMLHGFDAASGAEKFAYVPRTLLSEPISAADPRSVLVRLADPAFAPRFYVDGSPSVGDAYWGGAWRTVVVGTTGAGGRGVFALDISDPAAVSAGKVLWELDGRADPNLGYTVGQAVIGRLRDGNFYAIFGNGYRSVNACPLLYLVRLPDGQVRRLATGGRALTDTCAGAPNGLGRPSLHDIHVPGAPGYRTTDFAYAGDLQGNLWRFDLRSVNLQSEPPTGAVVERVFVATNSSGRAQPITGPIEIGLAPAPVAQAGTAPRPVMLWFGTGRHLAADDRGDVTEQSVYGVVDRFAGAAGRGDLERQSISVNGGMSGTISGTRVDYLGSAKGGRQHGWVLDLPRAGERMIGWPLLRRGRLVFASLVPDKDKCFAGASSIFAVEPHDGLALGPRIFVADPGADFIGSTAGIVNDLVHVDVGSKAFLFAAGSGASGTGGAAQLEALLPPPGSNRGRASWREVFR